MERDVERSHLRFLRKGDLRWPRENVITVAEALLLIQEWGIVRRPVAMHARSRGRGRTTGCTGREIRAIGRTITRTM